MNELNASTNLKIIGLEKPLADQIEPSVWASIEDEKKKKRQGIILAEPGLEAQQQFKGIEAAAGNLINAKLSRLEITIPPFEPVTYATNPKGDNREGYYDPLVGAVVYTNRPVADFDKYSTIAHAVSHLSTKNEVRQYMSSDKDAPHQTWSSGAEVAGNKNTLGGALEEGMATMDQVDFFNTYLQINFPDEYAKRRRAAESKEIKKQVERMVENRRYGEVNALTLVPFVVLETHNRPVLGPKVVAILDVVRLKEYLLARKMCDVLGKSLAGDKIMRPDEYIQLGRDLIDKDRYLRTQDAHRGIVAVMGSAFEDPKERSGDIHDKNPDARGLGRIGLGGIRARTIFAAKANDETSIDKAMAMFGYITPPAKPLIEPVQPKRPSAYQTYIEATPPTPVTPLERPQATPREPESTPASQGDALQAQAGEPVFVREPQAPAVETASLEPPQIVQMPPEPGQAGPTTPENPRLNVLRESLGVEERKLIAAQNRLDDILSRHLDREMDSAEVERRAIEEYEGRIYSLTSEINQIIHPS